MTGLRDSSIPTWTWSRHTTRVGTCGPLCLVSMLTHLRAARADLSAAPHHEPLPIPFSFTIGRAHAEPYEPLRPARLVPALHYTLGDGTEPAAWQRLHQLNNHLNGRRSAPLTRMDSSGRRGGGAGGTLGE
ncbi:DUF6177 family protein [Streptomyces sp. NPDC049837]|uniref:DUF6177 family protein n=1 Tax=Streptomyces sp. NPDC049837 TaxID=3155277 RepID=UPI003420EB2B